MLDQKHYIFHDELSKVNKLVVGQVQSGKTKYMIDYALEALSSDFDSVIVLGGNNSLLLRQTEIRFKEEFLKYEFTLIKISSTEFKYFPKSRTLITSLKTEDSLQKLLEFIKNSDSKRILILNDESDYGSINISRKTESTVFKLIKEINSLVKDGEYISITATPFADLLSKDYIKFDELKILDTPKDYTGISYFNETPGIYSPLNYIDDLRKMTRPSVF